MLLEDNEYYLTPYYIKNVHTLHSITNNTTRIFLKYLMLTVTFALMEPSAIGLDIRIFKIIKECGSDRSDKLNNYIKFNTCKGKLMRNPSGGSNHY